MAMFSTAATEATGASNSAKKLYLKQYIFLDKSITRKINEVAKWRAKLTSVTSIYTTEPKGGGSIYGKTEELAAKIVDLEAEINRDIDRSIDLRREIGAVIASVPEERERLLLEYRYLDGRTFEWIAAEMDLSWKWVHKLHSKALDKIILG